MRPLMTTKYCPRKVLSPFTAIKIFSGCVLSPKVDSKMLKASSLSLYTCQRAGPESLQVTHSSSHYHGCQCFLREEEPTFSNCLENCLWDFIFILFNPIEQHR